MLRLLSLTILILLTACTTPTPKQETASPAATETRENATEIVNDDPAFTDPVKVETPPETPAEESAQEPEPPATEEPVAPSWKSRPRTLFRKQNPKPR